jgi:hypothetical protein
MLSFLRDKKDINGKNLHLGNRQSIDSLIATHSAIVDFNANSIYVSTGPALAGKYIGFDLTKSFEQRVPIKTRELPADPLVTPQYFLAIKKSFKALSKAQKKITKNKCNKANVLIERAKQLYPHSSMFYQIRGDYLYLCNEDLPLARASWKRALELRPSYLKDRSYLRKMINE